MNTRLLNLCMAPALLIASVSTQASHDDYALEPSINGGVSANGLFASQAEEDRYYAALELEPCISGGVSASGRFASQAQEDAWIERLAGG